MEQGDLTELLELIRAGADCDYISDLHLPGHRGEVLEAICCISADGFTCRAWNEAIPYLTNITADFSTADEARAFLCRHLGRPAK